MQELDTLMQDKVETHCREQLSAMLDGALPPDQARFLLRRLQHDRELAGCWERWQLCGDLMRGTAPTLLPVDFASRVSAAIAAEGDVQAVAAGGKREVLQRPRWMGWAGGAALAASVAAVAFMAVQRAPQEGSVSSPAPQIVAASTQANGGGSPQVPEPVLPAPQESALATTAAAAVLAAAQAPRRSASRERQSPTRSATRRQSPAQVSAQPNAVQVASVAAPTQQVEIPAAVSTDAFAVPPSRPWPRAVLSGEINGALNANFGIEPVAADFMHFEPRGIEAQASAEDSVDR